MVIYLVVSLPIGNHQEANMFHIIVNPQSSTGRGKSKWDSIEKICGELTSTGEECTLVILGGDGTMNAVVNGIRDFESTKVGFIQTGTGNDLVKGLGISSDIETLIDSILRNEVVRVCDIGRVTYHNRSSILDVFTHKPLDPSSEMSQADRGADGYPGSVRLFNISAGIGFDAAVCQQADNSKLKLLLNKIRMGKLIYISEAIHMILASPMVGMKIDCDGYTYMKPRTLFAVVMNTCYEGGGFKFCPDAVNTDGELDLFGANDLNRLNFFRIFPTAYDGSHMRFKGLFADKGKRIRIRSAVPLWVHTDGEVLCKSSCITVDLYPHKLRLIV